MAVTSVTFAQSAGNTTSTATTSSFTPGAGEYLFAVTWARNASAYIDTTISDSLGLTWTEIGSGFDGPADNAYFRMRFWYTASPASAMTVSSTPGSSNANGVAVARVAMDTPDVSNVLGDGDDNGDPSVTLSGTPAHILTFAVVQAAGNWTQPSGYTEAHDVALASNSFRIACAYDLTSPGNPVAWTNANNLNSVAVAIELLEGSAPSNDISGSTAMVFGHAADLSGTGDMAGSSASAFATSADLTGTGDLAGSASVSFTPSGALAGTGDMAGTDTLTLAGLASLSGTGDIAGTAALQFDASGTIPGSDTLSGGASMAFAVSGTLEPPVPVSGEDTWDALPPQHHRNTRQERDTRRADVREVMRPPEVTPRAAPEAPPVAPEASPVVAISPEAQAFEAEVIDLQAAIAALKETRRNEARRAELAAQLEIAQQALYDEQAAIMLLLSA
jgi:hypothetical protein